MRVYGGALAHQFLLISKLGNTAILWWKQGTAGLKPSRKYDKNNFFIITYAPWLPQIKSFHKNVLFILTY